MKSLERIERDNIIAVVEPLILKNDELSRALDSERGLYLQQVADEYKARIPGLDDEGVQAVVQDLAKSRASPELYKDFEEKVDILLREHNIPLSAREYLKYYN